MPPKKRYQPLSSFRGRILFILLGVVLMYELMSHTHLTNPHHAVWKSAILTDTTQMDSLGMKLERLAVHLPLVNPQKAVWKSFSPDAQPLPEKH